MNLNIRSGTVGYNNKILISDEKFSLGKNDKVNAPAMKSHKVSAQTTTHRDLNEVQAQKPTITHKTRNLRLSLTTRKKLLWYFFWQVVLQYGTCLDNEYNNLLKALTSSLNLI